MTFEKGSEPFHVLIRKFRADDRPDVRRISLETAFLGLPRGGIFGDDMILADALITILIKLVSQEKTTVMTIRVSRDTMDRLKHVLNSGFRLLAFARLEIEKALKAFLGAMEATGKSV